MKKRLALALVFLMLFLLSAIPSVALATIYTFDSANANWYEPGELTKVEANVRLISDPIADNEIQGVWNTALATYGNFYAGDWAGASWTAPAGEIVTRVQMSGWYRADGDLSRMGYGLLGGKGSPDTEYVKAQGGQSSWVGYSWSQDLPISSADQVDNLQIRTWWHQGGDPSAVGPSTDGYFAYIDTLTITTTAVPEPATIGLLTLGGLLLRRRK
jgi:hypothetical protein